jgi:hypothetical protein
MMAPVAPSREIAKTQDLLEVLYVLFHTIT